MRPSPVVVAAILAAACVESFSTEVHDREPFDPPATYDPWWASVEDCSGLSGDMGRIQWFLALSVEGDGVVARARWSPPHDIILVRGYEDDPAVVRHEMLHDLLNGDRLHEAPQWAACGL